MFFFLWALGRKVARYKWRDSGLLWSAAMRVSSDCKNGTGVISHLNFEHGTTIKMLMWTWALARLSFVKTCYAHKYAWTFFAPTNSIYSFFRMYNVTVHSFAHLYKWRLISKQTNNCLPIPIETRKSSFTSPHRADTENWLRFNGIDAAQECVYNNKSAHTQRVEESQ